MSAERPSLSAPIAELWTWLDRYLDATATSYDCEDFPPQVERQNPSRRPPRKNQSRRPLGDSAAETAPRLEITVEERRAILRGIYWRSKRKKKEDSWRLVRARLESEWTSRDFKRLVSRLIEANVLYDNGMVPNALNRDDTKDHRNRYRELLRRIYPEATPTRHDKMAAQLVAVDLCLEDGDFANFSEIADRPAFDARVKKMMPKVSSAINNDGQLNPSKTSAIEEDVWAARLIEPGK